ncbi:diphthine synthase [Candidatus Pacearchaeota archaeon CG10_big_fil_rev_8_21_14_0_10_32_42]|nr:MAG: diphthine synthase [Candidatus Pacearchaeota archaeon CG10_big_fil_rev_8_21_14_0_10_32_42]
MLYLIGLGLNESGISKEGLTALSKCKKVYLENYTVDFPYTEHQLEEMIGKRVSLASREKVENLSLIDEAEKLNIALLVYGSPLSATTHITLINECRASGIKYRIIHGASIFDAIAETGLQMYKFGKTASMPKWQKNFKPESFIEIVKENQSINAHSLVLVDIGLEFKNAFEQLKISAKNQDVQLSDLVICQSLGTKNKKILYRELDELDKFSGVIKPYCIIIPSKLHFLEKETLDRFR